MFKGHLENSGVEANSRAGSQSGMTSNLPLLTVSGNVNPGYFRFFQGDPGNTF